MKHKFFIIPAKDPAHAEDELNAFYAQHKAAQAVQRHLRQYPWYAKIDVDAYFASIDHGLLLNVLLQRFKGAELTSQFQRILASYQRKPGRGLPIGSLTSQYFANYYLDGLDRLLANSPLVCAHIRYHARYNPS